MIRPLVTGFTENSIHTTRLQIDYDALATRVQGLEVIFNAGKGKNFIFDTLVG